MNKYTLALDASQLNQFGKCNLSWAYAYRENLQLSGTSTAAMDMGTLMHSLLDKFYKKAPLWNALGRSKCSKLAIIEFHDTDAEMIKKFSAQEIGFIEKRFIEYVMNYEDRDLNPMIRFNDTGAAIAASELGFSKVLYEDENVLFLVEGKIDVIHIDDSSRAKVIVDHKTRGRVNQLYGYRPQVLTYTWATDCDYFMYNYVGTQDDKSGAIMKAGHIFEREVVSVPKWMRDRWQIKMLKIFWNIAVQDDNFPNFPNEYKFEANNSNCAGSFDSSPCMFHHLCETQGDEMREHLKRFKYEKKEPWEPWKLAENKL
jgi:hypothetical protein